MPRLAALTGLEREARVLRRVAGRSGVAAAVAVGGLDRTRAAAGLNRLIADRPDLLLSFGFAGALDPALAPGTLVCPEAVRAPDGTCRPVDWCGRDRLAAAAGAVPGRVAGRDAPVGDPADKRALRRATGAAIVDMESHLVAEAAHAADLRFLVLRAVSDPAGRRVPPAFARAVDMRGRVRPGGLPALAAHPIALWALSRDSARALSTLARAAELLCRQLRDSAG